jgi:hypothetical protein
VTLTLTPLGEATLAGVHSATQDRLAELLAALQADERAIVARALRALRPIFTLEREADRGTQQVYRQSPDDLNPQICEI